MYIPPIDVDTMGIQLRELAMRTTENGILEAVWNMGFKVDAEQLTCALTQDKKRYEYAYDKGWHDCEEHYKKKIAQIADIVKEE